MAKAARTTITVPNELKERMNAVEEAVNWSALACKAFEEKLVEIAKKKGVMDRADVVARLRASKRQTKSHLFDSGFAAGEKWAKTEADAWELKNLDKFHSEFTIEGRRDMEDYFLDEYGEPQELGGHADGIAGHALGMNRDDWDGEIAEQHALKMFDNQIYQMKEALYVNGFLEGALSVWGQVKHEL